MTQSSGNSTVSTLIDGYNELSDALKKVVQSGENHAASLFQGTVQSISRTRDNSASTTLQLQQSQELGKLSQDLENLSGDVYRRLHNQGERITTLEVEKNNQGAEITSLGKRITSLENSRKEQAKTIENLRKQLESCNYSFTSMGWKIMISVPKMLYAYSKKCSDENSHKVLLSKAAISLGVSCAADTVQKGFKKRSPTLQGVSQVGYLATGSYLFMLGLKVAQMAPFKQSLEKAEHQISEASTGLSQLFDTEDSNLSDYEKKAKFLFALSGLTGCGWLALRVKNLFEVK